MNGIRTKALAALLIVGLAAVPASASLLTVGNELTPRVSASDGADAPLFYTNYVPMPSAGVVGLVNVYHQSHTHGPADFNIYQLRPTGNTNEYDVLYDSGEILATGADDSITSYAFPNGPVTVEPGDLFAHYGWGIPYSATGAPTAYNIHTIYYSVSQANVTGTIVLPTVGVFPGNSGTPGRVRDYAWSVSYVPEPSTFLLTAMAGLGMAGAGWRRRKRK